LETNTFVSNLGRQKTAHITTTLLYTTKPQKDFLNKFIFATFSPIIYNMKIQYTQSQINRFNRFCDRHGLAFANMAEYIGALEQFLSED
jgi:hypothetical protein